MPIVPNSIDYLKIQNNNVFMKNKFVILVWEFGQNSIHFLAPTFHSYYLTKKYEKWNAISHKILQTVI